MSCYFFSNLTQRPLQETLLKTSPPVQLNKPFVHTIIKIVSYVIILLGMVHISFAFPLQMNTETLWFTGAGMSIIFSGLLNLVALDRGGSKFTKLTALITNALNCTMFCLALPILNEPQVYVGISIFFITTVAFFVDMVKPKIPSA